MPAPIPPSIIPSPLELLLGDKATMNAIQDCMVAGEEDAINEYTPNDLPNKRGSLAYFKRDTHLHQRFASMGWNPISASCQRRILSPPGYFPSQIQLLHTRGWPNLNEVLVNEKGPLTETLIKRNAKLSNSKQYHMDFDREIQVITSPDEPNIPSIWIVVSVHKTDMLVYLVNPIALNPERTIFTCAESAPLFPIYQLNSVPMANLPQATEVPFPIIRKREDIDDEHSDN